MAFSSNLKTLYGTSILYCTCSTTELNAPRQNTTVRNKLNWNDLVTTILDFFVFFSSRFSRIEGFHFTIPFKNIFNRKILIEAFSDHCLGRLINQYRKLFSEWWKWIHPVKLWKCHFVCNKKNTINGKIKNRILAYLV